jgi:large repetitive protein
MRARLRITLIVSILLLILAWQPVVAIGNPAFFVQIPDDETPASQSDTAAEGDDSGDEAAGESSDEANEADEDADGDSSEGDSEENPAADDEAETSQVDPTEAADTDDDDATPEDDTDSAETPAATPDAETDDDAQPSATPAADDAAPESDQAEATESPDAADNSTPEAPDVSEQPESTSEPQPTPPPAEATAEPTTNPDPESTAEPVSEATAEPESTLEPEMTPDFELTPEVLPDEALLAIDAVCTGDGVAFIITNEGGAMAEAAAYTLDDVEAGTFELEAGATTTIQAGYGTPAFRGAGLSAQPGEPCVPPSAQVAGAVWLDANRDGQPQPDEAGLAGAQMQLLDANGSEISAQEIGADGLYSFAGLEPGVYTLALTNVAPELTLAVEPEGDGDTSVRLELAPGEVRSDVNFGFVTEQQGSVSGLVWLDANADGLRDAGEAGLPGITVALSQGETTQTVTTVEDGTYRFEAAVGEYAVSLKNLPDDVLPVVGSLPVTVAAGTEIAGVNFGLWPDMQETIRGTAWIDADGDGRPGAEEPGLPELVITLMDSEGQALREILTDASGAYAFVDLEAGLYTVRVDGQGRALASAAESTVLLEVNQMLTVNFAFQPDPLAVLTGLIWVDLDGDGLRAEGEPGLPDVALVLTNDEFSAEAQTAADGTYTLPDLPPDTYRLTLQNVPEGLTPSFDPDGAGDGTTEIVLSEAGATADFGYQPTSPGSISGRLWLDVTNFGQRDSGEEGLAGAVIELLDADGALLAAVTLAAAGDFTFVDLPPGEYTVRVALSSLPSPIFATYDRDDTPDFATRLTLRMGEAARDVDFGIVGTF